MEQQKTTVSVDVEKKLLLKFKSMCILKETTMSEEIEKMIRDWINRNEGSPSPSQGKDQAPPSNNPKAEPKPASTPKASPTGTPESSPSSPKPSTEESAYL